MVQDILISCFQGVYGSGGDSTKMGDSQGSPGELLGRGAASGPWPGQGSLLRSEQRLQKSVQVCECTCGQQGGVANAQAFQQD